MAILTEEDIFKIRIMIEQKIQQKEIAKQFNVSPMTISNIKNKKSWTHI